MTTRRGQVLEPTDYLIGMDGVPGPDGVAPELLPQSPLWDGIDVFWWDRETAGSCRSVTQHRGEPLRQPSYRDAMARNRDVTSTPSRRPAVILIRRPLTCAECRPAVSSSAAGTSRAWRSA
jgi:hypothetical protein